MKKIFFLLIGLMLCTAGFAQSEDPVTVFYVSPNGNQNIRSTDVEHPSTIQEAMEYIRLASVSSPTDFYVWVLDGTYDQGDSVKIVQQDNQNIFIQAKGDNAVMKLQFVIDGMARSTGSESVLIKDLIFEGNDMIKGKVFVTPHNGGDHSYPHNVTIESCQFKGNDNLNCRAINMVSGSGECSYNTVIKNCIAKECQGFYQSTHDENLKVENCQLIDCLRGFNVNQARGSFSISNTTITGATKYTVRLGQDSGTPVQGTAVIRNCSITGSGDVDPLIVMRGDCPDTLLLENVILEATADDGEVYNLASGVKAVVNKNSTLTLNNGKPDPQDDRLVGVDETSKLTVGADDLYKELKVADGVFQWDNTSNTWVVADTQYVYPAGIAKNIDNAVAKSIKHETGRDIVYFFTSVPDAVDFMTTSSSQICSMNPLGLDSVGINIIKDNTLTRTITVSTGKNVTLLDDKTVTTRDVTLTDPMISVANGGILTMGALGAQDSIIFDGGNRPDHCPSPIIENKGTVNLLDNVILRNNRNSTYTGGAVCNYDANSVLNVAGKATIMDNESSQGGAICCMKGTVNISGPATIKRNKANTGAAVYVANDGNNTFNMSDGLITENTLKVNSNTTGGVLFLGTLPQYNKLTGGAITNNTIRIDPTYTQNPHTLPADVRILAKGILNMGDSILIDSIGLNLAVVAEYQKQQINLTANLNKASASNPIVIVVDSLDKQVLLAETGTTLVKDNYMKFKPSSDTLAINNKGYVVRKPEIAIDTVYLLQKGTKYEDYGITTSTGEVPAEALYVIYTQEVDATGQSAKTTADSLVLNMSVDFNHGSPVMLDKKVLSNNQNTNTFVEIPFPSALTDGALSTGRYTINATAKVYTLGLEASDVFTQSDSVYIPTFDIDTLNFLLAGMKFSDYTYNGSCTLANTNDGAGEDIIPADEIFVGYQRSEGGNVDTAFIKVTLKDYNNVEYVYEEGTAAGQILEPGCGHFRQFTNSEKWTPALNLSDAFDGKDFTYTINLYQRTQGEPYFAVGTKTGTYHHEIDRECTLARENEEACNAMGIQFAVNATNDTISLTYPNFFDKNAVPDAMKQDGVIKVGISFDPQDEKLTMAWFDEATDITTTDGKYIVWIPISKSISETSPIVVAENYAITPDTLRLSHTEVNGVYRKTFVVKGTLTEANITPANITYHTTGASGVKFASAGGPLFKLYFDANDYTVWNVQNPTSFGKDNANVYAGLYINRPDNNVNAVYSSYRDFGADTVKPLADDLVHQLTDTAYIQYVKLGTCANQATKDYTFITKPSAAPANFTSINGRLDTVYWFVDNKFVKAERYSVNYFYAPQYTVNFNFHGGGATCNVPYSDTFADTTYVFGRPIVRPEDPFKCGNLFMDWRHGVDSFTVDSFKNIRAGIAEGTGATVEAEPFGIRSNMVIDAAWKYFVTIDNPHDTAVVAHYSLCEINTRDYVVEPTEAKRPYIYTFHKDYLGKYYREYIPGKNGNCDVKFIDDVYTESPQTLPVGRTSQVTWTVTDMCGTQFVVRQNVNVMFPPCGADNYNVDESAYVAATNNHGSLGGEYIANIDGKDYRTVRIGCNCWLKENLQNDQYANGGNIAIAKAYLDEESNVADFGRLYTWYSAVNVPEGDDFAQPTTANETITFEQTTHTYSRDYVQGICPNGWHIPALDEYQNLKDVVGAANAVKAVGSNYWLGFTDATDADHFTGIPAGYYDHSTDKYYNILGKAYFWSTDNYGVKALPCSLLYGCPEILFNEQNKFYGFSVRCVRNIKLSYE